MKQKLRIWLANFFGFSRTETNGFIMLLLLMVIILLTPYISKKLYSAYEKDLRSEKDQVNINSLLQRLEDNIEINKTVDKENTYKPFDLNKSNVKELKQSGFPDYLAKRIIKYREKVKPFEEKVDLLKIYGIDSSFYNQIFSYIRVSKVSKKLETEFEPDKSGKIETKKKGVTKKEFEKVSLQPFDINNADSLQLQEIYGIGPSFSERIVKYREYLGGFHSLYQLKEVYGLKKENLDSLKKYIVIEDTINLIQLKVNQLDADSLVQHPYISYKEANLIVNYRRQHGKYTSEKDLLGIKILDSIWIEKVSPYFSFE